MQKNFILKFVNMTKRGKGQEVLIIRNVFCESVFLSKLCVDVLQIDISCYVFWAHLHYSWKSFITFIMSVHPSAHMNQHGSPGWIFMKFDIGDHNETMLRKSKFC
jgi:hypothetical protein